MEDNKDIVKELESLVQLDIDAVHAYTSAIERIDLSDVKQQLSQFRSDHERHITDLSPFIARLGGEVPNRSPDFKGFFIQGFTALKSMISDESAIKAMKSNEELTNSKYEKALQFELPLDIKTVVQRNREDERRHLEYINSCIESEVWNRRERTVA